MTNLTSCEAIEARFQEDEKEVDSAREFAIQALEPVIAQSEQQREMEMIKALAEFETIKLEHFTQRALHDAVPKAPQDVFLIARQALREQAALIDFDRIAQLLAQPDDERRERMLEDEVRSQYRSEENFQRIMATTSYLGIIIACLGLFGMTTLSVARRTKEMGIRKVLGATSTDILSLFNREYLRLIVLANLLAWPVAYFAMQDWMKHFMYRVSLDPLLFLFSALIVVVLAVATISVQAIRAAHSDPVKTLRYE